MERVEGLGFMTKAQPEAPRVDAAKETHGHLLSHIADFEATLSDTQEVGARIVGTDTTIHLDSLGFEDPGLISFIGTAPDASPVHLLLHHSQLNVLLVALPKQNPLPRRLGK